MSNVINVMFGLVLIFIALIIFFEPVMEIEHGSYLPEWIDVTYLPYVFAIVFIALGVIIIFAGS